MKKLLLVALFMLTLSSTFAQTITTLGTENHGQHFKFIILGDGFTAAQQSTFNTKANDVKNAMMDLEPYKSNPTKINWYRVNTSSYQSGQSRLAGGGLSAVTKNTYWGVYSNANDTERLLGMPATKITALENLIGHKSDGNRVFAIIISNHPMYAGLGNLPSYPTWNSSDVSLSIVNNEPDYLGFLAMHETGHSFADLDDEYVDSVYANSGDDFVDNHPDRLNIKTTNPGGWLAGARYVTTKYRYDNGLMRSVDWTFHSRNEGLVQDRIDAEAITYKHRGFSMANQYGTFPGNACNFNIYVSKYHDGSGSYPVVGDYIYTTEFGTSFNGQNRWWSFPNNWAYKIDSTGKVTMKEECTGGVPR